VAKKRSSVQRVQDALDSLQIPAEIKELPASTRTAKEAADAVGCRVGQIVKSLVFYGLESKRPYLIPTRLMRRSLQISSVKKSNLPQQILCGNRPGLLSGLYRHLV